MYIMRVALRSADIDKTFYHEDGFQAVPEGDSENFLLGTVNQSRTRILFRGVNLAAILGHDALRQRRTYTITLVDIRFITENERNVIDYDSPGCLRTSNLWLSGPDFVGSNEVLVCPLTNHDPNQEIVFERPFFHRANLSDYTWFFQNRLGASTTEFLHFNRELHAAPSNATFQYCLRTNDPVLAMDNKRVRVTGVPSIDATATYFSINVQDLGNDLPAITQGVNRLMNSLTVIPEPDGGWFTRRLHDLPSDLPFGQSFSCYMPTGTNYLDLLFTVRDLLDNKLQPVVDAGGKVWPQMEFVLDIA
jgi:hypothetical protein